ncbi:MAG: hypothetical protein ACLVES_01225 [Faecalibacterium prausnitzii]
MEQTVLPACGMRALSPSSSAASAPFQCGVVVSLLQEQYGFAYGMTGTLLSLMSMGNLLAGLLIGMLPSASWA